MLLTILVNQQLRYKSRKNHRDAITKRDVARGLTILLVTYILLCTYRMYGLFCKLIGLHYVSSLLVQYIDKNAFHFTNVLVLVSSCYTKQYTVAKVLFATKYQTCNAKYFIKKKTLHSTHIFWREIHNFLSVCCNGYFDDLKNTKKMIHFLIVITI